VLIDIFTLQIGTQNGDEFPGCPRLPVKKDPENRCFQMARFRHKVRRASEAKGFFEPTLYIDDAYLGGER
jgi:hypothetical protein